MVAGMGLGAGRRKAGRLVMRTSTSPTITATTWTARMVSQRRRRPSGGAVPASAVSTPVRSPAAMFTPWMTAGSLAAALYLINQPVDYLSRQLRRLRPQGGHGKRHTMAAAFGHRLRLFELPAQTSRQGAVVGTDKKRQAS